MHWRNAQIRRFAAPSKRLSPAVQLRSVKINQLLIRVALHLIS